MRIPILILGLEEGHSYRDILPHRILIQSTPASQPPFLPRSIWRSSSVVFIEQNFGPHMLQ